MRRLRDIERIAGRPIFLVGFMGTGKSTVGRLLAERLGRELIDADERIEDAADASVRELFAVEGEEGFRQREAEVIRSLCAPREVVVATGGGAAVFGDNLERMLQAGLVVALEAGPDEILRRVGDPSTRPLLARAHASGDARGEVSRLLERRQPSYRRAHLVISTDGRSPMDVVEQILESI